MTTRRRSSRHGASSHRSSLLKRSSVSSPAWATRRSETARAAQALAAAKVFDEWTYDPDHQLSRYEEERPHLNGVVERNYQLVKTFRVVDPSDPANHYDRLDLLYLPFAGFHDVELSGPNLYIYARR